MREVTSLLLVLVGHAWVAAATLSYTCGPDAKPHPLGKCGAELVSLRDLLCRMLSQDYPEIYSPRKRSSALADAAGHFDLIPDDEGNDYLNTLWDWNHLEAEAEASRKDLMFHHHPKVLHPRFGSDLAPTDKAALEDPSLSLLQPEKRSGMSCECCFNPCRPSILARYC